MGKVRKQEGKTAEKGLSRKVVSTSRFERDNATWGEEPQLAGTATLDTEPGQGTGLVWWRNTKKPSVAGEMLKKKAYAKGCQAGESASLANWGERHCFPSSQHIREERLGQFTITDQIPTGSTSGKKKATSLYRTSQQALFPGQLISCLSQIQSFHPRIKDAHLLHEVTVTDLLNEVKYFLKL